MFHYSKSLIAVLTLGMVAAQVLANNIQVTNVAMTPWVPGWKIVSFDLSWENSWRVTNGPANWDAAWVFVKFQRADGNWYHGSLHNVYIHNTPPGATVTLASANGTGPWGSPGFFIYRSNPGIGSVTWSNVAVYWCYDGAAGGPALSTNELVTVDVEAVEMVYIPTGSFYVGDGVSSLRLCDGANTNLPFRITSAAPVTLGPSAGRLWSVSDLTISMVGVISNNLIGVSLPAGYPVGYNAFYCMKYECSEEQLMSMRNKLTANAHAYTASTPETAAFVSPQEVLNYLDWSALRPMTELEYEKVCRGPTYPIANEFAWGTAVKATLPYGLINVGTPSEAIGTNYDSNAGNSWAVDTAINYLNKPGVRAARVGVFALPSYSGTTSGRIQSGASYFGVMELTGNMWEPTCPIVLTPMAISSFNGRHGDGALPGGAADEENWSTNFVFRGGGIVNGLLELSQYSTGYGLEGPATGVSSRAQPSRAYYTPSGTRSYPRYTPVSAFTAIRGVRTAP